MSGTCFFFSSRRRHTRCSRDWSSDVCSSDLFAEAGVKSAFHAGYSNGRYLFYLLRKGIDCGGTDLELTEAPENEVPARDPESVGEGKRGELRGGRII